MKKKIIAILAIALLVGIIACDNQPEPANEETQQPATGQEETVETGAIDLDGMSFSIWAPFYWVGRISSYDESAAWQEVERRLGITIDWQQPAAGQEIEQFNLMIASQDFPDIIGTGWEGDNMWVGGGDRFIEEGVILRLNELAEQHAPDYMWAIENLVVPEQQSLFFTDEGNMFSFYAISPYEEWAFLGLLFRQDWMDELGLDNPRTLDEVEHVLRQFRDYMGADAPLLLEPEGFRTDTGVFVSAWDIGPAFYQVDGVVHYGPIQPEFREFLELMNRWFEEGLIDADFATRDDAALQRLITAGNAGAIVNSPDTVGAWMEGISPLMGGHHPMHNANDRSQYRQANFQARPPFSMAITTAAENPAAAATFLNWGYTEEGFMLMNFGIEGETYVRTGEYWTFNGVNFPAIEYTDMMMNNPDFPVLDAILNFKMHIGPFIRFEHEGNPAISDVNRVIREFWTEDADATMVLPPVTLNADEGREFARIMAQVQTFQDTAVLQFIMGVNSLDEFDDYIAALQQLGIEEAIALQQAALDRFNARVR